MQLVQKAKQYRFLFSELVKRDFKQKYKRTVLGMVWSALSPLCYFLILKFVFTYFFSRSIPHYTTYLFIGIMVNSFYSESTNSGMFSLLANGSILSKINVPKYIFLLSKNVSCLINFGVTFLIFIIFALVDHIPFHPTMFLMIYPTICLIVFNIGVTLWLPEYLILRFSFFLYFEELRYKA